MVAPLGRLALPIIDRINVRSNLPVYDKSWLLLMRKNFEQVSYTLVCLSRLSFLAAYRRTHNPRQLAWSEGQQPLGLGAVLHSSDEPDELSK